MKNLSYCPGARGTFAQQDGLQDPIARPYFWGQWALYCLVIGTRCWNISICRVGPFILKAIAYFNHQVAWVIIHQWCTSPKEWFTPNCGGPCCQYYWGNWEHWKWGPVWLREMEFLVLKIHSKGHVRGPPLRKEKNDGKNSWWQMIFDVFRGWKMLPKIAQIEETTLKIEEWESK